MEYFESNVDAIRSQVKANRAYTETSNLFKPNWHDSDHFISRHFLTAVNQEGRTEKAEKVDFFLLLMKTATS